jgi:glycosyltransferase involved in cell wall biosynthesis
MFSESVLPVLNGVSISVDTLVQELRNRGHSVHIFAPNFIRHHEKDPNTHRFRAIETPWAKGYPFAYPPFWRMLLTFRKFEFDVIHTHTPWIVGFVGMRWAESHGIPLVSTYHTLYDRYAHYLWMFPRRYIRFRIAKHTNFYYNSCEQVIAPTPAAERWLQRHGMTRPVHVIPTGIPRPQIIDKEEARGALGIPTEHRLLLYVGRLAKEKNLETLIQMVARVSSDHPRARLWMVGDGPYQDDLRALASKLGVGDRVKFVGAVPRNEVDQYYASADLFTFASVTETQGLVVQEAMQYGLPAVAISGGGASDSIEEGVNGLVTKNTPEDFSAAVTRLLDSPEELEKLAKGAHQKANESSIELMVDRIIEVYELAIARRKTEQELGDEAVGTRNLL